MTTRHRRAAPAVALLTAALSASACGSSGRASTSLTRASKPTAAAHTVVIDTFMFRPASVHVRVGETVRWTNRDDILHTVTSGTREYEVGNGGHVVATRKDGLFDLRLDGRGASATHRFTAAGTFHYFCDRHPGMEGDVDVS